MGAYTYAPKNEPPKGTWKSIYGGFERTPFARYMCGATVTEITRDQRPAAKRARIRARKRLGEADLELLLLQSLAALEDDETKATKEFFNG